MRCLLVVTVGERKCPPCYSILTKLTSPRTRIPTYLFGCYALKLIVKP